MFTVKGMKPLVLRLTCTPSAPAVCPLSVQGAWGYVDLVLVTRPGGAPFRAARKRMPTCIAHTEVFADEVAALRVGQGCRHVVQLLDVRSTDTHHELLFELMEGGTLQEEMVGAGAGAGGLWLLVVPCADNGSRTSCPTGVYV